MIAQAGCTIVSGNYLAYARTLCGSFKEHHPGAPFYVLLVDELDEARLDVDSEPYELIGVQEIGIEDFEQIAFKFNILELNTNVKPTFLKFLMQERTIERVIYLDPDILVCDSLQPVFEELDRNQIILTPHCTSPITDEQRPSEQDFLEAGVFNLGFVGVRRTEETIRFLEWWGERCLTLGFSEMRSGLFVDQKWCNLAPCLFEGVGIIKDCGWNMAYWNLHERKLTKYDRNWMVNEQTPLRFFHFSGISMREDNDISRHQNRYDLTTRSDLVEIFAEYKNRLRQNGMEAFGTYPYKFGRFSNGVAVTQLARSAYAANADCFGGADPFDAGGKIYRWCKKNHLIGNAVTSGSAGTRKYRDDDWRAQFIGVGLKLLLKVVGSERYTVLMRYLSRVSLLRNQGAMLFRNKD